MTVALALALAGCGGLQAYEGPRLPPEARAVVVADPAFSAGLPVAVILRKVDETSVPVGRSSVELAPGRHSFLVDCRVAESGGTTRHVVEAEVEPGQAYRLEAQATARGCERVLLVPR